MMSQNKMAAVVWGLCTWRHWARWCFPMIAFINSNKGEGEAYSILALLPALRAGIIIKKLM